MPLRLRHILDRLPLPSLRHYTLISTSLFVGSLFYYHHLLQSTPTPTSETLGNETRVFSDAKPWSLAYMQTLISAIVSQSVSLLILVNAIYCSIGLCGKYIQEGIFGELRLVELQRIKEKFWNYAFYKFCFLFGVLGIQSLNELALWTLWFSVVVFSLLLCQLSKDRFELLSVSASIRRRPLLKILGLLVGLLVLSCVQLATCFFIGLPYGGLSIFFFMLAEASLLTLEIAYLLFNYTFQYYVYEQQKHNPLIPSNEYRSYLVYYIEFFYHMLTLIIDIVHHMQMLFYHQTFMSMTSLILFMQLRPLFHELTQRLKRHKIYRSTMIRMEKKYPLMTKHDLEQKYLKQNYISSLEEVCSICWEKFEKARCLPCGHLFHQNCLRGWLEQDTTCPICRLPLQEEPSQQPPTAAAPPAAAPPTPNFLQWPTLTLARFARNAHGLNDGTGQRPARNHLFRFDGSRYSSWLPTFSIEINHNFPFRFGRARLTGVQLAGMAQHVQQVFPQIPYEAIVLDLQRTQSIDLTIENIIDHRIRIDLPPAGQPQDISGSEDTSYTSSEASSSDVGEPIDADLLSEMPQTTHTEDLIDLTETDNFAWPLDPQLPIAVRKQHLIAHMRRRFLERERRLQAGSPKSDLLSDR